MRESLASGRNSPNRFTFNEGVAGAMIDAHIVHHIRGLYDMYQQLDSYLENNRQVIANRSLSQTLTDVQGVDVSAARERARLRSSLQSWFRHLYGRSTTSLRQSQHR
jgi:hypothetical protein